MVLYFVDKGIDFVSTFFAAIKLIIYNSNQYTSTKGISNFRVLVYDKIEYIYPAFDTQCSQLSFL